MLFFYALSVVLQNYTVQQRWKLRRTGPNAQDRLLDKTVFQRGLLKFWNTWNVFITFFSISLVIKKVFIFVHLFQLLSVVSSKMNNVWRCKHDGYIWNTQLIQSNHFLNILLKKFRNGEHNIFISVLLATTASTCIVGASVLPISTWRFTACDPFATHVLYIVLTKTF